MEYEVAVTHYHWHQPPTETGLVRFQPACELIAVKTYAFIPYIVPLLTILSASLLVFKPSFYTSLQTPITKEPQQAHQVFNHSTSQVM